MLRVLEVKAAAGEAAIDVTDLAMQVCGGAAFRKELGVERRFRDARAARVMAPTTDALHDFIGRALLRPAVARRGPGVSGDTLVMGAVAYDPKVVTIWDGFRTLVRASRGLDFDYVLYSNYERQVEELLVRPHRRGVELAAGVGTRASASPRPPAAAVARRSTMRDTDRDLTSVVVVRGRLGRSQSLADLERQGRRRRRDRLAAGDADPALVPARRRGSNPAATSRPALRRRRRAPRRPHRR